MKASHFNIGNEAGDMLHPKPTLPIDGIEMIGDGINAAESAKRLRQASWTTGQSPMCYESIQRHSFYSPGKTKEDHATAQKQLFELKARIASSSVMDGKE